MIIQLIILIVILRRLCTLILTSTVLCVHRRLIFNLLDGDGVEEAFYTTNRVMTVSFHQYGDKFFPESGDYDQNGKGDGLNYSINVPIKPGITSS